HASKSCVLTSLNRSGRSVFRKPRCSNCSGAGNGSGRITRPWIITIMNNTQASPEASTETTRIEKPGLANKPRAASRISRRMAFMDAALPRRGSDARMRRRERRASRTLARTKETLVFFVTQAVHGFLVDHATVEHEDLAIGEFGVARIVGDHADG